MNRREVITGQALSPRANGQLTIFDHGCSFTLILDVDT